MTHEMLMHRGVSCDRDTVWKVKRIPGRRTWYNWFPRDVLEISTEHVTMCGTESDLGLLNILGEKWKWAD